MAYKIMELCVSFGACEGECPLDCISYNHGIFTISLKFVQIWHLCRACTDDSIVHE
ncbi:ferredoxin [Acidaminobacter sp. JC074]|uniref:ferredoxin n=1 Tax=Acidaminobacter sp. JC074 TaxID=2530199 RepID=UPI001F0FF7E0|nr:ferredoxin [Acidaminobacter sp. JC074]MCH4891063.1 ferredoxin [Acidaminobacter sp. JC074]